MQVWPGNSSSGNSQANLLAELLASERPRLKEKLDRAQGMTHNASIPTRTYMFTAVLVTIARTWSQPRCPLTHGL